MANGSCKGLCHRFPGREVGPRVKGKIGRYELGFRYCSACEYYILTENARCACCNRIYRTTPGGNKYRQRLRAIKLRNNMLNSVTTLSATT